MSLEDMQLGRYHLLRPVGSGGMGEIYLAEDPAIHRQVAIKVIRTDAPEQGEDADMLMRFSQREAQAVAALDHPLILPLYDYGETQLQGATFTYLVMPYREDGSLADWLQQRLRSTSLTVQDVVHIAQQAATALQYAHDHQIIHLDVKPSNFLLRYNAGKQQRPDLLLTDFGIAKLDTKTTRTSQNVRGTPTYMAPELWEGHPTPATDQYALAIMLYELLTGSLPFQGNIMQLMYAHLHTLPPTPSSLDPRLPATVDTVLLRALAKRPDQRFPSVMAFASALQQTLAPLDPMMPVGVTSAAKAAGEEPVSTPVMRDLHATLAISEQEARAGGKRNLMLPDGRHISVVIPVGAQDGLVIRVDDPHMTGDARATQLYLKLAIVRTLLPGQITTTMGSGNTTAQNMATVVHSSQPVNTFEHEPTLLSNTEHERTTTQAGVEQPLLPISGAGISDKAGGFAGAQSGRPERQRTPVTRLILFSTLVLLLLLGSGGLYYYFDIAHGAGSSNGAGGQSTNMPSTNGQQQTAVAYAHETATAQASIHTPTATTIPTMPTTQVTSTTPTVTNTANPNANPYPPYSSTLVLNDPMKDNSGGHQWDEYSDASVGNACQFENGAYHVIMPTNYGGPCYAKNTNYTNFTYEAQMTFISAGPSFSGGGLVFRASANKYYVFEIFESGRYSFYVCVSNDCSNALATDLTNPIPAFHIGLSQSNRIAVVAHSSMFDLYVNGQLVKGNIADSANTSSQGEIGLYCEGSQALTDVAYSNVKVWA